MRGIYTAIATPFAADGEIDFPALDRILDQQTRAGVRGFVVCGTTGESPTLSKEEKEKLLRHVHDYAKGKSLDLVAGTGTNDTRESILLTKMAEKIGYRRFLVVVPYYNKPSQAGLLAHFTAIADAVGEGIVVLYNVPGRTGISLAVDTIVALAAHPKIRAIKEASGDLKFLADLRAGLAAKNRSLDLLSGDDATYYPFLLGGGHGVISVASHVCPRGMLEIEAAVKAGDRTRGDRLQAEYLPLFTDLFVEANPGPLKWMLERLGLCENRFRLPLVPIGEKAATKLETVVAGYRVDGGQYVK
ncbi:MAG: 4-hydroxy-tetrahydrodipicolinate synthase [Bdellovibrionales bacterium]|nr:4-hydroxy-tetrahydrodipicolinate synthase [Bdellovibrionales bacterium]